MRLDEPLFCCLAYIEAETGSLPQAITFVFDAKWQIGIESGKSMPNQSVMLLQ